MSNLIEIPESVRRALATPQPQQDVRTDVTVQGAKPWQPKYISAPALIRRLNETFNYAWGLRVLSESIIHEARQVVVKVALDVPIMTGAGVVTITKEAYGHSAIEVSQGSNGVMIPANLGYNVKAAVTDGLRKAATLFGIGLELYERDEAPMQGGVQSVQQASQPAPHAMLQTLVNMFEGAKQIPRQTWLAALQVSQVQDVTVDVAQQCLAGTHPYVLHLNNGVIMPYGRVVASNA